MKYRDLEVYFNSKDSVLEVADVCNETFDRVDEIGAVLRKRGFSSPAEIEKLICELNGINIFLSPILGLAESAKTENEDRYFFQRKIEIEKEGGKVVAAVLDREASCEIANYRRIRNAVEAYVEVVKTAITSAQSILKNTEKEFQASK